MKRYAIAAVLSLLALSTHAAENQWFQIYAKEYKSPSGAAAFMTRTYVNTKPVDTSYGFGGRIVTAQMMNKTDSDSQVYNVKFNCTKNKMLLVYTDGRKNEWEDTRPPFDAARDVVCN